MKEEAVPYITAECLKGNFINLRQFSIKPHYYTIKICYSSNSNFLRLNCAVWGNNISILNIVRKVVRNSVGEALVLNQKSFSWGEEVAYIFDETNLQCSSIYIYIYIYNNYSPQCRWLVLDIYWAAKAVR